MDVGCCDCEVCVVDEVDDVGQKVYQDYGLLDVWYGGVFVWNVVVGDW